MCENPGICTYFRLLRHPADHLVSKNGRFCSRSRPFTHFVSKSSPFRSRNRAGVQDCIFVLAGDGEFDVVDIEEVSVGTSDCLLVDEEGPMDPEEMGTEDGFPLGDGGLVPETAVARRDDGGDVVVGFHVQDFLQGEGDRLPVRCEGDGGRPRAPSG